MGDTSRHFEGQWFVSQEGQISFEDFRSCLVVGSTCSENPGKSSRRKGNGPQDMEIDHVGTVQSSLSSKACQTKAVVTEVNSEHKKPVETLEGKREISCIPHVSAAENVGHFKNMRRGC